MNDLKMLIRVAVYGIIVCFAAGTYDKIHKYNEAYIIPTPEPPRLTIIPRSGKWKHVNEAMELSRPGDCVQIPAGTWTWSNYITVKNRMLIQGSTNGQTKIKVEQNAFIIAGSNNIISDFWFENP